MKNGQTIAQFLNVKEFPFYIKDKNGNVIYYEESTGYWFKCEFDSNGNVIYYENSYDYWAKYEYDVNGNGRPTYFENSKGYWEKQEYNTEGKCIYFENSDGEIRDNRPKEVVLSFKEIAEKFNINVKDLKIKE